MIQMISGSHKTHITAGVITVTTQYIMDILDFYNGYGDLYDADGVTFLYTLYLPSIGDNYTLYHSIYIQDPNSFWNDVVLSDISEDRQKAYNPNGLSGTSWELDKKTLVTYTWSNTGKKDIIRAGDASSIKINIETNTEVSTTSAIIDKDTGVASDYKDVYFAQKNPTIYYYYTDADGAPQAESKGAYNSATSYWKNYHREHNDAPQHEVYHTKTILTVTVYSRYNYQFLLQDNVNKINSTDLLQDVYNAREVRLLAKNKLPTYAYTDIVTGNDSYKWLFFDYTKTELANSIYQYDLMFLYKPDGWTTWYGATVDEYYAIDFYTTLIYPMVS